MMDSAGKDIRSTRRAIHRFVFLAGGTRSGSDGKHGVVEWVILYRWMDGLKGSINQSINQLVHSVVLDGW